MGGLEMNKADRTEQLINKLTEQLDEAKAELVRINKPKFELHKSGHRVYSVGEIWAIMATEAASFGTICKTIDAAERLRFMQYKLNIQFQIAEFLNEGWAPDWANNNQDKYVIVWCRNSHCYMPHFCLSAQYNTPVFKTKELTLEAIEIQKTYLENLPWEN